LAKYFENSSTYFQVWSNTIRGRKMDAIGEEQQQCRESACH
jgi:hypothetical protein